MVSSKVTHAITKEANQHSHQCANDGIGGEALANNDAEIKRDRIA